MLCCCLSVSRSWARAPRHPGHPAPARLLDRACRRSDEARDQLAALLPVREQVLGPEHPDTVATRTSLAQLTNGQEQGFFAFLASGSVENIELFARSRAVQREAHRVIQMAVLGVYPLSTMRILCLNTGPPLEQRLASRATELWPYLNGRGMK